MEGAQPDRSMGTMVLTIEAKEREDFGDPGEVNEVYIYIYRILDRIKI